MSKTNNQDTVFSMLMTEHSRVHSEILHHKTSQQTIINFIIILFGGELAFLGRFVESGSHIVWPAMLLTFPLPFALLAMYHSAYTMRIHKLANYRDSELWDNMKSIVGTNSLQRRSYYPTCNIFQVLKSTKDGRLTYLSLFGLKCLPQLIALGSFLRLEDQPWKLWELLWFIGDIILCVLSSMGQND